MRIAAFTMVHNETDFLPLWVSHYGREIGHENLYCIDHGSDDGSVDQAGIHVTRFARGPFDETIRAFLVANFHASLLRSHDVVIFADADEFLVADPARFKGLRDAIADGAAAPVQRALGLDVFHDVARETGLDRALPVFAQRRRVRFARHYCKTLIASVPVRWDVGFHACSTYAEPRGELFLFHLKYADRDIFTRTLAARRQVEWSANDVQKRLGYQWQMNPADHLALAYDNRAFSPPGGDAALEPFDAYVARWRRAVITHAPIDDDWLLPPAILPERFRDTIPGISDPRRALS